MLNQKITSLLNEQINKELYSAYLYLEMADYYNGEGLEGFENWFYIQAQEEKDHAMLIRTYLLNNDKQIRLETINEPGQNYTDFSQPLEKALEHEKTVTASIHSIYSAAMESQDYRTLEFLTWFVKEQGEEEKNSGDLIKKYQLYGGDPKGLYELDRELGLRVYAAPTLILE